MADHRIIKAKKDWLDPKNYQCGWCHTELKRNPLETRTNGRLQYWCSLQCLVRWFIVNGDPMQMRDDIINIFIAGQFAFQLDLSEVWEND